MYSNNPEKQDNNRGTKYRGNKQEQMDGTC